MIIKIFIPLKHFVNAIKLKTLSKNVTDITIALFNIIMSLMKYHLNFNYYHRHNGKSKSNKCKENL